MLDVWPTFKSQVDIFHREKLDFFNSIARIAREKERTVNKVSQSAKRDSTTFLFSQQEAITMQHSVFGPVQVCRCHSNQRFHPFKKKGLDRLWS